MKIHLKKYQFEYLEKHLSEEAPGLFMKLLSSQINSWVFDLEDDIADSISDWAGEKMQRVGFEGDDDLIQERDTLYAIIDNLYF